MQRLLFPCLLVITLSASASSDERADAEALLERVAEALPDGWNARLLWTPEETGSSFFPDWLSDDWRNWLPGRNGRRIDVRRAEPIEYWVNMPGPEPNVTYARPETSWPRFALTIGPRRDPADIEQRRSALDDRIGALERELAPSAFHREPNGYVQHAVPPDDAGKQTLREYDRAWTTKRWFPRWSDAGLSIGYRPLSATQGLPDEHRDEFERVKAAVVQTMEPAPAPDEPRSTRVPTDQKIDYVEFPANDFDAIERFYSGAFGWSFTDYGPEYRSFTDDKLNGGFYESDLQSRRDKGAALVVLYATDLEATHDRVVEHGGTICQDVFEFPGGRRFHFLDPHGNELAVWSDK